MTGAEVRHPPFSRWRRAAFLVDPGQCDLSNLLRSIGFRPISCCRRPGHLMLALTVRKHRKKKEQRFSMNKTLQRCIHPHSRGLRPSRRRDFLRRRHHCQYVAGGAEVMWSRRHAVRRQIHSAACPLVAPLASYGNRSSISPASDLVSSTPCASSMATDDSMRLTRRRSLARSARSSAASNPTW